jgi:hypothetical protein
MPLRARRGVVAGPGFRQGDAAWTAGRAENIFTWYIVSQNLRFCKMGGEIFLIFCKDCANKDF